MIVFCFMVQGQIVLKKESDGNDKKLTGISNKCNTQTVWKPTSEGLQTAFNSTSMRYYFSL